VVHFEHGVRLRMIGHFYRESYLKVYVLFLSMEYGATMRQFEIGHQS